MGGIAEPEAGLEARAATRPRCCPVPASLLTDTPIYQQLAPDSPLLAELNRPGTLPVSLKCHCFYGDILVRVVVLLGGLWLLDHTVSFGNLAVPTYGASKSGGAAIHTASLHHPEIGGSGAPREIEGGGATFAGGLPPRDSARQAALQPGGAGGSAVGTERLNEMGVFKVSYAKTCQVLGCQ